MPIVGQIIDFLLFVAFVVVTWWAPRRYGLRGMFGAHVFVGAGVVAMIPIAMITGIWQPGDYDGGLQIVSCLFMAFLLNCLFLPIVLVAMWTPRSS